VDEREKVKARRKKNAIEIENAGSLQHSNEVLGK